MTNTQRQKIFELRQQIRKCERHQSKQDSTVVSTGSTALDDIFSDQGVRRGSLVEWVGSEISSGATTVSLMTGRYVCLPSHPVVLVDPHREVFPLALSALGFDLSSLVIVHPGSLQETLWTCEEALKCEGVGLVWAAIDALAHTDFRRLQLAAERSSGIGFLVRPEQALRHPSWAETRLLVRPRPSPPSFHRYGSPSFQVDIVYSQGRATRSSTHILIDRLRGVIHELDDAHTANCLSLVS